MPVTLILSKGSLDKKKSEIIWSSTKYLKKYLHALYVRLAARRDRQTCPKDPEPRYLASRLTLTQGAEASGPVGNGPVRPKPNRS